jgi:hypothetical protein
MINVKRGFWLGILSAVCCYTAHSQAQVFKCVDPDGHVTFSDTDCGSTKQEVDIVQSSGGLSTSPATGLSPQERAALSEIEARDAEIAAQRAANSAIGGSGKTPAPSPSTAPKSSY